MRLKTLMFNLTKTRTIKQFSCGNQTPRHIDTEGLKVRTSSWADFMAMGIQIRTMPAMAMAVLRFQCTGRQFGPPVMLQTFALKSPPCAPSAWWWWSPPPPPIFAVQSNLLVTGEWDFTTFFLLPRGDFLSNLCWINLLGSVMNKWASSPHRPK